MKKLLMTLAIAGMSMGAFAQDSDPVQKYSVATNSFWSNWFIQLGGDWHAWYPDEKHGRDFHKGVGLLSKDRRTFGASVALGKWFTPGLGLRTKMQAWQGKDLDIKTGERDNFDMWILNEHIMFNLSNIFCGYNPNRVWNLIPFMGGGVSRNMSYNLYAMQLSAGIQSTWRLGKHANLYLEAGWNRLEEDFSGDQGTALKNTHHNRGWEDKDNDIYGEIGLTFNLGRATWDKVPDVDAIKALSQSQIDALNAQLNDANAENARLKNLLANQPKPEAPKAVKEFVTTPVSVFFNINRTNIASQKDLVNVEAVAKYAKENGSKLAVTGYADSATGNAEINQRLSEGRAATVADELVKLGVDRSNISTVGKGGVDDLSPISFNRRATVQVVE
ncbi:MAG: OmpA family protein [Prevotella sp.]|jgi:OOP family OmpA-OmpF porin